MRNASIQNRIGLDDAAVILYPFPDRGLCLGGDLLAYNVMNDGGKQIGINRALYHADLVYRCV